MDIQRITRKKPSLNHIKQRVFNNSYVVQFWDKPARTIIAHLYKDGNQFIHPDYNQERTITPREAARLQSFLMILFLRAHGHNNTNKLGMLYHL